MQGTSSPLLTLTVTVLVVGSSNAFSPVAVATTTMAAKTATIRDSAKNYLTQLRVNNDKLDEYDRSLEYALRGDDYAYRGDDYYNNLIPTPYSSSVERDDIGEPSQQQESINNDRAMIDYTNLFLRVMYNSFKNVEGIANELLQERPMLAFAIFVGAGLATAYMLGSIILCGCMESWNPLQNGMIPYWDEEILVMYRKIH